MKISRKILSVLAVTVCSISLLGIDSLAASSRIRGTLNYRVLDGSANNKFYTIGANKSIKISGSVEKIGYNKNEVETNAYGQKVGVQTTYLNLYEKTLSGRGNKICSDSVKVSSGSKQFSATGKSKNSNKKYMYIYKGMNDGYDLSINGTISY